MKKALFSLILVCFIFAKPALCVDSIEILSGYLRGTLDGKKDYEGIPVFVAFNYEGNSFIRDNTGLHIKGELNFVIEPFFTVITSPNDNVEAGVNFLCKYAFPLRGSIKPYVKLGVGVLYMTQHTREQSTQYNFLPQAGLGVNYLLNDTTALSFEYRTRHLSNASIKAPNKGIDADLLLMGVSFSF